MVLEIVLVDTENSKQIVSELRPLDIVAGDYYEKIQGFD